MRQLAIVVLLLVSATEAVSQGEEPRQERAGARYFGAPVAKYTVVRNQGAVMFGGRGAWNLTPSLLIGGGVYGTWNDDISLQPFLVPAGGDEFPAWRPTHLKFETFGIDLEYALHPTAPAQLTFSAFLGGGAAHELLNRTDEQLGETDFMLVLEPAVGFEPWVSKGFHLNIAFSYRLVSGAELAELANSDFNGWACVLAAKIGRF